ncbi:MAG: chromosome segregation protein SMC [Capsulimonadaceae bacterium]|nr:chromosome segregation protein SMC [Capsulimonadaceae bacterium]
MHLKRLQLTGFKTFADKTEIQFSQGVTAIVGPNGSGKSNIADALLWTLGETKASAVRGAKASDVIFNGAAKRKQLGLAEVCLTVDNSDGSLPLAFDEVTITRRAYRNGEGEYFINKTRCRLKDIYELFLDTGVGREAYALVNQSEIDAVLSADPEARRGLFEEAAGIKKYRVKKREALKKLEATEANLTRIRDILTEIDAQIEPMSEQAELAIRYNALRSELSKIERDFLIVELRAADSELSTARDGHSTEDAAAERLTQELADAQQTSEAVDGRLAQAEALLEEARGRLQAALSALERARSERQLAAQRAEGLGAQLTIIEQELDHLGSTHAEALQQAAALAVEATAAREELNGLAQGLGNGDVSAKSLTERIDALRKREEQRRAEAMQIARQQAVRQAELARAEARAAEIEASLPSLKEEEQRIEKAVAEAIRDEAKAAAKAEESVAALRDAQAASVEADDEVKAARERARTAERGWDTARGEAVALSTRLRALTDLEEAQEGYFQGVKAVVQAARQGRIDASFTVVADAFTAPPGYETALEIALGGSVQDIITFTEAEAKDGIEYLKQTRQGRATFLPLERMRPSRGSVSLGQARSMRGFLGPALDLIDFDPKYRPALEVLLGRVLVCETLDDALAVSRAADGWGRIVTLSGDVVSPTGAMTGGIQQRKSGSLLGRKTELAELRKRLDKHSANEQAASEELEKSRKAVTDAQALAAARQQQVGEARVAVGGAQQEQERIKRDARRTEEQRIAIKRRVEEAGVSIARVKESIAQHAAALANAQIASVDTEQGADREREELAALINELESVRGTLTQERIAIAGLTEKASGLERAARTAQADADRLDAQIRRRREQYDQAQQELGQLQARAAQRDQTCDDAAASLEKETANHDVAQAKRQELATQAHEAQMLVRRLSDTRAVAVEAVRKHELREQRYEMQTAQLSQRLLEEYDTTAEYALSLDRDPEAPKDTPREVARLRREIRAMGDVNTGAAEEYQRLIDRQLFLVTQKEDSEDAKAKLVVAINEIDESTRDVFMASFNAVGEAFDVLFKRLFGGGETQLVLTRPDDLLDTGVDIIVQTPGKKKQNLMLLSGGERALTATALLFAFLKVRPAPFCVLDEVDAPLDGVNVERFADLLRDFGKETQFLVITHNPSTMEAAPIWYGVTMTEPGISRILSLEVPAIQE